LTSYTRDAAGAVTERYAYSEYGALLAPPGFADELFLFAGQCGVLHLGNGLYAARQRVYDSGSGAFLPRDPRFHLSPLLAGAYTYAAGNPRHFFDVTEAGPGTPVSDVTGTVIDATNTIGGAAGVGQESGQVEEDRQAARQGRQGRNGGASGVGRSRSLQVQRVHSPGGRRRRPELPGQ
jgi:RHS repeat-associated protein